MSSDNIKEEIKFVARRVYCPLYRAESRLGYWKAKCVRPGGAAGKLEPGFSQLFGKYINPIQINRADLTRTTFLHIDLSSYKFL